MPVMRGRILIFAFCLLATPALSRKSRPIAEPITTFDVGELTFFDFGPPFDYYQIYVVRTTPEGSSIERVILTPPGSSCMQPAKLETASALLSESVFEFLSGANPCAIPEKKLTHELKRCKKCLVFSGASIRMRVRCGSQDRIILSKILDRDIYDSTPNTPRDTSWTLQLMNRMDQALGSSVSDKPVFPLTGESSKVSNPAALLADVSLGKYDSLFTGSKWKPSDLYRASQIAIPSPDIKVVTNLHPEKAPPPEYPPLARLAHIEGKVILKLKVSEDGGSSNVTIESGHEMLRAAAEKAVRSWKFSRNLANQEVKATIEFIANCPANAANQTD
jgi:TonB family protein